MHTGGAQFRCLGTNDNVIHISFIIDTYHTKKETLASFIQP